MGMSRTASNEKRGLAGLGAVLLSLASAAGQVPAPPPLGGDLLGQIGIDQELGAQAPLDLVFRDESGVQVPLGRYFGEKPVVLALVYYRCPMLCQKTLEDMLRAFRSLKFAVGREFQVVTVSFDPRETPELAAAKKASCLSHYGRPGAEEGWHFLTGEEASIVPLARACGFRYRYDPKTDQYAHASGIMVLTPEGKLSRYFYGLGYSARDLQLGLVEASRNRIGSLADQVLLFCYRYDPTTGKYGFAIMSGVRIGGLLTLLGLGAFIVLCLRRERRRGAP